MRGIIKWRPITHMPHSRSRLTLTVEAVKVCRVQDITEEDIDEECFFGDYPGDARPDLFPGDRAQWGHLSIRQCFARVWNADHGPGAWERNDWTASYTVRVERQNIDKETR